MNEPVEAEIIELDPNRAGTLGFLASLYVLNNELKKADLMLLELLACTFFHPERLRAKA